MAIDILNPTEIINALFGNMYFFAGLLILGYLYIASKYRFNFQLSIMGMATIFMLFAILEEGFASWITFIIVGIGMFLAYVFWRYIATK
jgi:hypothetical protein